MAKRKITKSDGHYLAGSEVTIDNEINFVATANPEIDTSTGDAVHKVKTNSAQAHRVRDHVAGVDILTVDTTTGIEKVILDADLTFAATTNPEIDTTGGGFIWKIVTAIASAWKLRDNTKGQDIITIDTSTDTVTANNTNYTFAGFAGASTAAVIQKTFADSPYTASWGEDIEVDCSGGNVIVNYPTAVGNNGGTISVMRVDASANTITVDPAGAETINGQPNTTINSQWDVLLVKSNGTNLTWR